MPPRSAGASELALKRSTAAGEEKVHPRHDHCVSFNTALYCPGGGAAYRNDNDYVSLLCCSGLRYAAV